MDAKDPIVIRCDVRPWKRVGKTKQEDEPEKKIPSTAAKAINRSPKVDRSSEIHLSAQSAFFLMQGTKETSKY